MTVDGKYYWSMTESDTAGSSCISAHGTKKTCFPREVTQQPRTPAFPMPRGPGNHVVHQLLDRCSQHPSSTRVGLQ